MISIRMNWIVKPILLGLCSLAFCLSSGVRTEASNSNAVTSKPIRIIKVGDQKGMDGVKALALKRYLLRLIGRNMKSNPNLSKALANGCTCAAAAPEQLNGFVSCMKGCLADAGIGTYALILCAGSCYFGVVPACALCLGVSVAVVEVCALGCAAYPRSYRIIDTGRGPRNKTPGSAKPNLRTQTVLARA